ncbi:MAG: PD-(D/E)XK nuclease family protein [Bacteroidetes bacterium]|nr:PD-(D/E)XK nuclease family protein [Bacteroidota bacterium]
MENIFNRIVRELPDNQVVFVFPTEVTANSWMRRILRDSNPAAVRTDRFISWDTFLRLVSENPDTLQPAGAASRRLFAVEFLLGNASKPVLQSIVPLKYAKNYQTFISSVAKMLPDLLVYKYRKEHLQNSSIPEEIPKTITADLDTLESAYSKFLSDSKMFEPVEISTVILSSQNSENIVDDFGKRYSIFFPEVITELSCIEDFGKSSLTGRGEPVVSVSHDGSDLPKLQVYEHAGHELSALLGKIEKLLRDGVDPSDIAVTAGSYGKWMTELKGAADLRGIPLRFRKGQAVSGFPVTRIFRDMLDAAQQNFSLESMKKLLLNRSYPWQDREIGMTLVKLGIEYSCAGNYRSGRTYKDVWEEKLKKFGNMEVLSYYRKLSGLLRSLKSEESPTRFFTALMQFWNAFLHADAWGSDGVVGSSGIHDDDILTSEQEVISFCLDNLRSFIRLCESCSTISIPAVFSLWLSVLDTVWYVPKIKDAGISVYPYGISAGITPDFHFVMGMTQSGTEQISSPLSFLQEHYRTAFASQEKDLTEAFIQVYAASGTRVEFSCCRRDFDGSQLPAGWFVENDHIQSEKPHYNFELFSQEQHYWFGRGDSVKGKGSTFPEYLYPVQKEGFLRAAETVLSDKGFNFLNTKNEDESVRLKIIESVMSSEGTVGNSEGTVGNSEGTVGNSEGTVGNSEGTVKISPTTVDTFSACPFNWLLTHTLKADQEDFTLVHADPRVIGILIHNCYADMYREIKEKTGSFSLEKIDLYVDMIHGIIDYRMDKMAKKPSAPIEPVQVWLRDYLHEYLPGILFADAKQLDGWTSILIEESLSSYLPGSGVILGGRLDRAAVGVDSEGSRSVAVIDYKKNCHVKVKSFAGSSDAPDSYQLPLYAFLLESEPSLSDVGFRGDVTHALYYDVTKRKYVTICGDGKSATADNFRRMIAIALEKAEETARKIQDGDFRAVPGLDRCKSCSNRDICRGRFAVQ